MTLKEKFGEVKSPISSGLEKIADDYAIEFGIWLLRNYDGSTSTEDQLKTFKKDKRL